MQEVGRHLVNNTCKGVRKAELSRARCWTVMQPQQRVQPNFQQIPEQAWLLPAVLAGAKELPPWTMKSTLHFMTLGRGFNLGQGGPLQTRAMPQLQALMSNPPGSWENECLGPQMGGRTVRIICGGPCSKLLRISRWQHHVLNWTRGPSTRRTLHRLWTQEAGLDGGSGSTSQCPVGVVERKWTQKPHTSSLAYKMHLLFRLGSCTGWLQHSTCGRDLSLRPPQDPIGSSVQTQETKRRSLVFWFPGCWALILSVTTFLSPGWETMGMPIPFWRTQTHPWSGASPNRQWPSNHLSAYMEQLTFLQEALSRGAGCLFSTASSSLFPCPGKAQPAQARLPWASVACLFLSLRVTEVPLN